MNTAEIAERIEKHDYEVRLITPSPTEPNAVLCILYRRAGSDGMPYTVTTLDATTLEGRVHLQTTGFPSALQEANSIQEAAKAQPKPQTAA